MDIPNIKKFISIAEKPGTFGVRFHNEGYKYFGLNNIYLPLKVAKDELDAVMQLVRENFAGCSVSMPHKEGVLNYLDSKDKSVVLTGAANTVLNTKGSLKGYNTDYYGALEVIKANVNVKQKKVLVLGAGGVAKAIICALKDLGAKVTISNRTKQRADELAKKQKVTVLAWEKRNDFKGELVINATSIGFFNNTEMPIHESLLENVNAVMDVVIADTTLIQKAKEKKKKVIIGKEMTTFQAAKQFEIYTGKQLPPSFLQKYLDTSPEKKPLLNFILDVDGVMTDGKFLYNTEGKTHKLFGPHDADGLKLIKDKVNILFITADKRGFAVSKKRIEDMGYAIELVTEGDRYNYIKERFGFKNTIYMGDGIFDAPIIKDSKFGIAPQNARIEAKRWANFVTPSRSAEGAVCDACIVINKTFFKKKK